LNPRNGLVERFGLPPGTRFVTETQRIAAAGGGNSVAMVQIDGNRMGSVARELASRAHLDGGRDYETFSEILRASTQAAAAAALAAVMPVDGGEIAARPIVLGGDDLGIVLPPAVALDFVCRFLDRFEKETEARLAEARSTEDVLKGVPTRFSAGAGIAWAHSHYPFDQAHGMAGSLCHWAKESLHAADGDTRMPPSAVAFFRLTSSMVSEFDTVLANELSEGGRTLTMGPYVLGDPPKGLATLKQLQDLCRAAARMPGGSWRKLVSAAHQGQLATKNHLRRMVETAADKDKAAQELRQALADMGCGDSEGVSGFDRAGRTPILDVETLQAVGAWGREDA
ncbi:MAG TPA: hypothetical protein VK196_15595, partial [Magnetospirillum sp.]|nr:hypothetical protein [Magnetospirillum sp.]